MSDDQKVDPVVFVDFLGKQRQVFYDFSSAKLFQRLTGKSILKRFDIGDAEQIIPFFLAGLKPHNPDLVGTVDMNGTPDELTAKTMEQIEKLSIDLESMSDVIGKFLQAFNGTQPKPLKSSENSGQKKDDQGAGETGIS